MPVFKNAHSCFWTWKAGAENVNEIDIAEAYGRDGTGSPFNPPINTYVTHAWWDNYNKLGLNPCGLPLDASIQNNYPNQSWWPRYIRSGYRQSDWHTYAADWDSTRIRFYLDGSLVGTVYKYTTWINFMGWPMPVGVNCQTYPGQTLSVIPGFPWSNTSQSQLRFTAGIDGGPNVNTLPGGYLGEMEIDYVKIYQRKIDTGYSSVCDSVYHTDIIVPQEICNGGTYKVTATRPKYSGYWLSDGLVDIVGQSETLDLVVPRIPNRSGVGALFYHVNEPGCPAERVGSQMLQVNGPTAANVTIARAISTVPQSVQFYLTADVIAGMTSPLFQQNDYFTFSWEVKYGPNLSSTWTANGRTVRTPPIFYSAGIQNNIKYKLTIVNSCNSVTQTGQFTFTDSGRTRVEDMESWEEVYATAHINNE